MTGWEIGPDAKAGYGFTIPINRFSRNYQEGEEDL